MVRGVSHAVLPPPAEKPRYVAAMFDRIAWRYDLMNSLMTGGQDRRWRRIVASAALGSGDEVPSPRVLDVGTGTGKLALAIQAANPNARVVGADFSAAMLRAAHIEPAELGFFDLANLMAQFLETRAALAK